MRVLLFALLLAGCGDDAPAEDDAGADAAIPEEGPARPVPPEPAALPVMTPCPEGWREIEEASTGTIACEVDEPDCDDGAMPVPGRGCRVLGACPDGEFADDLPPTNVRYVDDVATSGDGTRSAPFDSIGEALSGARPGTTIAIGKGRFDGAFALTAGGTTLIGACAAETTLVSSAADTQQGLVQVRADAEVRSLTIADSRRIGVVLEPRSSLVLRDVRIRRMTPGGVIVFDGAHLETDGVLIEDTTPERDSPLLGAGLFVSQGGEAILSETTIRHATTAGIVATGTGARIDGARVFIEDTVAPAFAPDFLGVGATIRPGAVATFRESVFLRNEGTGLEAYGGMLTLEDAIVRGTRPDFAGVLAVGLSAIAGGQLVARRVVVDGHQAFGVMSRDEGSSLSIQDAIVRGATDGPDPDRQTISVGSASGASIEATRVVIAEGAAIGVQEGEGGTATLHDVTVRDMAFGGIAIRGATATIERADLARCGILGLGVDGEGASLDATDVRIAGIAADDVRAGGRGVDVRDLTDVTLSRFDIGDAAESGLLFSTGSRATVADIAIHDIAGRGIEVQPNSVVSGQRISVERASEIGLFFGGEGAWADLVDLRIDTIGPNAEGNGGAGVHAQEAGELFIRSGLIQTTFLAGVIARDATTVMLDGVQVHDVAKSACSPPCLEAEIAIGIGAYLGASVQVTSFGVDRSALCGIQLAESGMIDLSSGRVVDNPVGVCLQVPDYDMARLTSEVRFERNGINLDATRLPIPSPAVALGPLR